MAVGNTSPQGHSGRSQSWKSLPFSVGHLSGSGSVRPGGPCAHRPSACQGSRAAACCVGFPPVRGQSVMQSTEPTGAYWSVWSPKINLARALRALPSMSITYDDTGSGLLHPSCHLPPQPAGSLDRSTTACRTTGYDGDENAATTGIVLHFMGPGVGLALQDGTF